MQKKRTRIFSYVYGFLFIASLVFISTAMLKLIENYRENIKLNEMIEKIENDYNEQSEDEGYFLKFNEDELVNFDDGKIVIFFPNIID